MGIGFIQIDQSLADFMCTHEGPVMFSRVLDRELESPTFDIGLLLRYRNVFEN